jgi:hypothetical protein
MTRARGAALAGGAIVAIWLAWLLFVGLPQWFGRSTRPEPVPAAEQLEEADGRKINVQLFWVGADGRTLTSVEREVAYEESTTNQARAIVTAQLGEPPPSLASAVPPGTALRAVFVTNDGQAFVDLSPEIVTAHPGGSTYEHLTVYALVNALTVNLSAVHAVQLLVDGREVDTLAGHLDLRGPLTQDLGPRANQPETLEAPVTDEEPGSADEPIASNLTPE